MNVKVILPIKDIDLKDLELALNRLEHLRQNMSYRDALIIRHGNEAIEVISSHPKAIEIAKSVTVFSEDYVPEHWRR